MKERVTAREKKQKEEGENKGIMFPKENERPTNYSGRKKKHTSGNNYSKYMKECGKYEVRDAWL